MIKIRSDGNVCMSQRQSKRIAKNAPITFMWRDIVNIGQSILHISLIFDCVFFIDPFTRLKEVVQPTPCDDLKWCIIHFREAFFGQKCTTWFQEKLMLNVHRSILIQNVFYLHFLDHFPDKLCKKIPGIHSNTWRALSSRKPLLRY